MKESNLIQDKSFAFAIRIVNLYKYLVDKKKEAVLSKQLLRCGTSIGANIEEAIGAQSDKDFLHKISISYKEVRECIYWLKLLYATNFITSKQFESINVDAEEIAKIIAKIQLTFKKKISIKENGE